MKSSKFPLILIGFLLVGPRLVVLPLKGSSVRVEDFIFVANLLWLLGNRSGLKQFPRSHRRVFWAVIVIGLIGIGSTIINVFLERIGPLEGILYSLRPVQYVTILPTMYLLVRENVRKVEGLIEFVTIFTFLLASLQTLSDLKVGTSRFSFVRSSGFTGGPYELGMLSILLLVYWLQRRRMIYIVASLLILSYSASRISIFAALMSLCFLLFWRKRRVSSASDTGDSKFGKLNPQRRVLLGIIFGTILLSVSVSQVDKISKTIDYFKDRIESTELGVLSWSESRNAASSLAPILTSDGYIQAVFVRPPDLKSAQDASSRRRYYVWNVLINTVAHNKAFVFGLGPGFASSAVDGNFVRIYGETGIIGLGLLLLWIRRLVKETPTWFKAQMIAFLVTAIYIDILTSLKSVILLYLFFCLARSIPEPDSGKGLAGRTLDDFRSISKNQK